VLPVDMPFLSKKMLLNLLSVETREPIVKFEGWELPVVFQDLIALEDHLNKAITENSKRSFKSIYSEFSQFNFQSEESLEFFNANTQEEWNEALSAANHFA
jgi:molybdopterin-guanine dinucleotide biosynthesis protein A